jgi:hypothetical protein
VNRWEGVSDDMVTGWHKEAVKCSFQHIVIHKGSTLQNKKHDLGDICLLQDALCPAQVLRLHALNFRIFYPICCGRSPQFEVPIHVARYSNLSPLSQRLYVSTLMHEAGQKYFYYPANWWWWWW